LQNLGFQIVALSPDRPEKLSESVRERELSYQLLSDHKMEAALGFGLAYRVSGEMLSALKGYGVDLEERSGETHHLLPVPAVFLIRADGTVAFSYANPNYQVRLHPDILLAAAKVEGSGERP